MSFDSDSEVDFTKKYIQLLSNELFLSAHECQNIIDADNMTEEEMLNIKSAPLGDNITDA